jgi:hypothetical protein
MKTEAEVRAEIKEIEEGYEHVLSGSLATTQINAPRACMQIEAVSRLQGLYWMLGERRPQYPFEKQKKANS